MSLVVEDGTGLPNANSYISIADADAYHADRGNPAWSEADEPKKTSALIRASQWLDAQYRGRWLGLRSFSDQALEWPRRGAVDRDGFSIIGVPVRVPYAVAEAALAVIQGVELTPVLKRGGQVKRKKVGPIETEFADGAPARDMLTAVSDLVRGYTRGPGLRITR